MLPILINKGIKIMNMLKDKVAFISGGASGLGKAMVERFVSEGARVFFGDINTASGEAIAQSTGSTFIRQDVAEEADWVAAIKLVEDQCGRLDIIINNAGILGPGALEEIEVEAWDRLFAINVRGVMLGCKHGSILMQRNPDGASGSIINISSNAAILATAMDCGYSASKGAVRLMTKSIGVNFARRGLSIRCNSIHPGPIDTPIFDPMKSAGPEASEALAAALKEMTPMGRVGRPEEVAAMAVFLASDESSFSTGCEFVVDGGGTSALAGL